MDLRSSNFTKALQNATQASKWQDTITDYNKLLLHQPQKVNRTLNLGYIPLKHQLWNVLEFNQHIYYFFTNQTENKKAKQQFSLTTYCFERQEGKNHCLAMTQLKGSPSCIASGISAYLKKDYFKQENKYAYTMVLLIGLKEGFVKIVEFRMDRQEKELRPSIVSHKLQQKPIVSIVISDKIHFQQKNISFIMFQDNKVFVFNYVSRQVVCIYQPPMLGHDHAVGFALHCSVRYFATCSRSGQITFWELNEKALTAISMSQNKTGKDQSLQDSIEEEIWSFKPKDRVVSVFPMSVLHAASLDGLKWIGFMGNLVALVTTVNFEVRDEYILLLQYQIPNGQSISSVQLWPEEETLIIFKSYFYTRQLQESQIQLGQRSSQQSMQDLMQKENLLKSKNNFYKFNYNALEACTNEDNCIERIKFGGDLKVVKVDSYAITSENRQIQRIGFKSGVVVEDQSIIMCSNQDGFFIGPFESELILK